MSSNPWMKRHKRYLSFRYIFPRVAAAGISLRRGLLRIGWFFTHSIDELLGKVRDGLRRIWAILVRTGSRVAETATQFAVELVSGIASVLRWFGRLPVWTGAALAGVTGIVLTLLLFLLPQSQTDPVPVSIGSDLTSSPHAAASVTEHVDASAAIADEADGAGEEEFDPFAPLPDDHTAEAFPQSGPEPEPFVPVLDHPELLVSWSRLRMPLGWESGRRIDVVSLPQPPPQRDGWLAVAGAVSPDGWEPRREDRISKGLGFSPYVSHVGEPLARLTPRWFTPEAAFEPADRIADRSQPSVLVEKAVPSTAAVGQPFEYALVVTNAGDETLESIQVREQISDIERVANVEPSANVVGDALVWELTGLQPGEHRRLRIVIQADEPLTLAQHTTVEVTSGVGAVSEARHPRPEPPLAEPEPTPEPTPVQEEPELSDEVLPDFGGEPTESSPTEAERSTGEPRPALIPGDFDSANGLPPQQDEPPPQDAPPPQQDPPLQQEPPPSPDTADATTSPEALAIEMTAPAVVSPGSDLRTYFVLHNRGEADLTNVVLAVELSDELQHRHGRSLELRLDRLAAGQTYRTRLTTRAVQDGNATISSRVRSSGSREQSARRDIRISRDVVPTDIANGAAGGCAPVPCPCGMPF